MANTKSLHRFVNMSHGRAVVTSDAALVVAPIDMLPMLPIPGYRLEDHCSQ